MNAETTVWRMETRHHHGPLDGGPEAFKEIGLPDEIASEDDSPYIQLAKHVPWMRVHKERGFDWATGRSYISTAIRTDASHPHHREDVMGLNPDTDDGGYELPGRWEIGTKDPAQLDHWFPVSSDPWFASKGFCVVEYRVPCDAVKFGTYQLMFEPSHAKLVASFNPVDFAKREALTGTK